MNPPEHIRGRLTCGGSEAVKRERAEWIIAQNIAGHTFKAIAAALGVDQTSVARHARRYGHDKYSNGRYKNINCRTRASVVNVGALSPVLNTLTDADQDRIVKLAIKYKGSIAEALVKHYLGGYEMIRAEAAEALLARAYEAGRDDAADRCDTFSGMDHIAQDMDLGIFPQQSERQEAISRAIRALTPPADLAARLAPSPP